MTQFSVAEAMKIEALVKEMEADLHEMRELYKAAQVNGISEREHAIMMWRIDLAIKRVRAARETLRSWGY